MTQDALDDFLLVDQGDDAAELVIDGLSIALPYEDGLLAKQRPAAMDG